jgi:hypothetical protein
MKWWLSLSLMMFIAACGETPREAPAPPASPQTVTPAEAPAQAPAAAPETPPAAAEVPPAAAEAPTPPASPAPTPDANAATVPAPTPPPGAKVTRAWLQIVDLEGKPLAGMAPIVTRQPNAFDEPVATSGLTGPDGKGYVEFVATEHLYLRAWDPQLNWFPNNYFDVHPNSGDLATDLQVVMVPAAALESQVFNHEGEPLPNVRVRMMLILPSRGPWWPVEATSDAEGMIYFNHVPAGIYSLVFTSDKGQAVVDQVSFTPKKTVDLGVLTLQP